MAACADENRRVLAIAAHPDDIELYMAGTLIHLRDRGWEVHYLNIANGCCGTATEPVEVIAATRQAEAQAACATIGARWHAPMTDDLQIYHTPQLVAQVTSVVRDVKPRVVLLQSPTDYMVDHEEACRVGVTASFCRGMRNAPCQPPRDPWLGDTTLYHAMPHGLCDPLRKRVRAGLYVDVTSVMDRKRAMLAEHRSQKEWLDVTQGFDSYLDTMADLTRRVGDLAGCFQYAEGWRRHLHIGFSTEDNDPLAEALDSLCIRDLAYEARLQEGE